MNSAYELTYKTHKYTNIYDAFLNRIGNEDDYFETSDLYADIGAMKLNNIIVENRNSSLTDVFNSFFIYSDTEEYVNEFKNYISLSDITNFTKKKKIFIKKIDRYNYNFSTTDIQHGIDAFVDYLYNNYNCEII